ncbi:hypothetical protein BGZ63DRAFT_370444 [Mariannaea sp. PMI_226]|nr:hypothetical protein BGZ63DRAFT_370444 [Mariannaea sp. PMI_226]
MTPGRLLPCLAGVGFMICRYGEWWEASSWVLGGVCSMMGTDENRLPSGDGHATH